MYESYSILTGAVLTPTQWRPLGHLSGARCRPGQGGAADPAGHPAALLRQDVRLSGAAECLRTHVFCHDQQQQH